MTSSGGNTRLRLMEVFHNQFYTPIHVAVAGGFLYREGLDVMFSTVPSGQSAGALLKAGEVDIVQTGLSRSLMELDEGYEEAALHIAEINQRDGFYLVSRNPTDGWAWKDIEGATITPVGFTPVPWMSLRFALKRNGVDLESLKLIEGLSAGEALERFRNGEADYIHMPNPQAQQLVEDGAGYVATAIGNALGYICYSSFAVTPKYLDSNPDVVQRFVNGFFNAQKWLDASEPREVVESVASFFPETSTEVLERGIRLYKEQNNWATDPLIGKEGFTTLRDVLIDGGLVKGSHAYERLVRPEFARKAMQQS